MALAAGTWSKWSATFPASPCPDGWAACRTPTGPVGGGTLRDVAGRPLPADARIGWFDLEPTAVFSPFTPLSVYTGAAAGHVAAMMETPAPVATVPTPAVQPIGEAAQQIVAPTPSSTSTSSPSIASSPSPSIASSPSPSIATSPSIASSPSPSIATSPSPSPTMSPTPTHSPSPTMSPTPTHSPSPTMSPTPTSSTRPTPVETVAVVTPTPLPAPLPVVTPPTPTPTAVLKVQEGCDDLVALEPAAMIGQLSTSHVRCLEGKIEDASQTTKDKLSRVLIANAEGKGDRAEWERLMKRHLEEIDRSDPDLCFRYALQLSRGGVGRATGVIRWTETALDNKHRWEGSTYKKRVFDLYRLRAEAANRLWSQAEQEYTTGEHTDENQARAEKYRGMAKDYAREWLDYAAASAQDTRAALALCVSAAGNRSFCEG